MKKSDLRKHMKHLRDQYDLEKREKENDIIIRKIKADPRFQQAKTIAIFYPMGSEIDLRYLMNEKQTFCFPKIEQDGMHFYAYYPMQAFAASKFGVMEPLDGSRCDDEIDYMLTPALAISKEGYRIGYGKGYYDQFLTKYRPKHVFGVIFSFQEVDTFDVFSHDQKLDGYFKGSL